MSAGPPQDDVFKVPRGSDLLGAFISKTAPLWIKMGTAESDFLAEKIRAVPIRQPVYVCGLARSGSTILLELLASVEGVVTHRYKDFPPIYIPFWWNWLLDRLPKKKAEPVERTHLDGIEVTPDSPEAFEEVLWMRFFPHLHDPAFSNVLDERTENPGFETFYKDHIRKLLLVRRGARYVTKGNYNITRLKYILKLFPDARFVIPVRRPAAHIASLVKQHALFCEGERKNPRMLEHMRRVGHFEFGLDRRPINTDAGHRTQEIIDQWEGGEEIRGWARYWSQIHGHLADELDAHPGLRDACLIVRYEDFCQHPGQTIRAVLEHARLAPADPLVAAFSRRVKAPTYYKPAFSEQDTDMIRRETDEAAARFGY